MSWLNTLKHKFNLRKLRIIQRTQKVDHDFIDIDKAKKIGMIVNSNECNNSDFKLINTYIDKLKSRNKNIFLIELNFLKKSAPRF